MSAGSPAARRTQAEGEQRAVGSGQGDKDLKLVPVAAPEKKLKLADVAVAEAKSEKPEVKIQPPVSSAAASPAPQQPISRPPMGSLSPLLLLNRALALVVLGLIVVTFYAVMSIKPGIAKEVERQIEGAGSLSLGPQTIVEESVPALEFYLDKVSARNPFVAKVVTGPSGPVASEKAGAPKDLKLIAVSVDGASPADSMAIIKNKTDSKTYFVKLGQTVGDTDYVLDKVLADRIVLKNRKQEYELK